MGRQCVERGYTFVWEGHSSEPYFILPDARRLYCTVEGYIPFLDAKAKPVTVVDKGGTNVVHDIVPAMPAEEAGGMAAPEPDVPPEGIEDAGGEHADEMEEVAPDGAGGEALEFADPPEPPMLGPADDGRRDLKAEARSVFHQMFHWPKNPHCPVCQQALARRKPNRRKKEANERYKKFGDMITMDHIVSDRLNQCGLEGERDLLVVYDLGTGWLGAYPVTGKHADKVASCLTHFIGHDTVLAFHSDNAKELLKGAQMLRGPPAVHDNGIPGVHQSNSYAEVRVKQVIHGTRAALLAAGLPHVWWPYAARCYATHCNMTEYEGSCPMKERRDEAFAGKLIPFGALIQAMPSADRQNPHMKFEAPMQPAIFLGYILRDGGRWHGEYIFAFVDDFAGKSFYRKARWNECRVSIHTGREILFDEAQPVEYPCYAQYIKDNNTVDGVQRCVDLQAEHEEVESLFGEDPSDDEGRPPALDGAADADAPPPGQEDLGGIPDDLDPAGVDPVPEPYPEAVAAELEALQAEIEHDRGALEFIPSGVSSTGRPVDQFGNVIVKTTKRPPYLMPDEWSYRMMNEQRKAATERYQDELAALATKRDRAAVLNGILADHARRGGAPRVVAAAPAVCGVSGVSTRIDQIPLEPAMAARTISTSAGQSTARRSSSESDSAGGSRALSDQPERDSSYIAMPVVESRGAPHREQNPSHSFAYYALTARDVKHAERAWNTQAQAALQKEWDRLRACKPHGCWDEVNPREYDDVTGEHRRNGTSAHFGRVFDICVEKNHHLPEGTAGRKYKGRAVYQGNNVKIKTETGRYSKSCRPVRQQWRVLRLPTSIPCWRVTRGSKRMPRWLTLRHPSRPLKRGLRFPGSSGRPRGITMGDRVFDGRCVVCSRLSMVIRIPADCGRRIAINTLRRSAFVRLPRHGEAFTFMISTRCFWSYTWTTSRWQGPRVSCGIVGNSFGKRL